MMMNSIPPFASNPSLSRPIADRDAAPTASDGLAIAGTGSDDTFATALDRAGRDRSSGSPARVARPAASRNRRDPLSSDSRTTVRRRTTATDPAVAGLATPSVERGLKVDDPTPTGKASTGRGAKTQLAATDGSSLEGTATASPMATSAAAVPDEGATTDATGAATAATAAGASASSGAPSAGVVGTIDPALATQPVQVPADDGGPRATPALRATPAIPATPATPATPANAAGSIGRTSDSDAADMRPVEPRADRAVPATPATPAVNGARSAAVADPATPATPATAATPAAPATPATPATPAAPGARAASTSATERSTDRVPGTVPTRSSDAPDALATATAGTTPSVDTRGAPTGGGTPDDADDNGRRQGSRATAASESGVTGTAGGSDPAANGAVTAAPADGTSIAAANQVPSTQRTSGPAARDDVSNAAAANPASADRLLDQVVGQIRLHGGNGVPGLESRFHDPQLGDLRLVLLGRAGETIRAELIATDPATAAALGKAADRALAGSLGLVGIDLRIRSEAGSFQANAGTQGRPDDRPAGSSNDKGNGPAGAFQQSAGDDAPSGRRSATAAGSTRQASRLSPVPTRSTANARTRSAGLDVRA